MAGIVKLICNATGAQRAEFACQADKGFPVAPLGRAAAGNGYVLLKLPNSLQPFAQILAPLKADKRAEIADFRPDAAFALSNLRLLNILERFGQLQLDVPAFHAGFDFAVQANIGNGRKRQCGQYERG